MRFKNIIILACLILLGNKSISQDSTLVFSAFMDIVKNHHPFVYKGNIIIDLADAKLMKARGSFDPKISSDVRHKSFDDKNYYTLVQGGLNVPLWFGSDVKVQFDRNNGQFLNNSDFLPSAGLLGPGIELVLGRGLLNDNRRAVLRKSKLLQQSSEFERSLLINELLYKASQYYFYWQESKFKEELLKESVELARIRLANTVESYINGYTAAVDTLEVKIELQNRQQALLNIQQENSNQLLELGNFLWMNGSVPLSIDSYMNCDSINVDRFKKHVDSIVVMEQELLDEHPLILLYENKLDQLDIDDKLNRENLKPDLRLSYSPLIDFDNQIDNGRLFMDNYKLGASFSYSLFTRKERADVKITELKISDTEFDLVNTRQKIQTNLKVQYNSIQYLMLQLEQIEKIRQDSKSLLDAENEKLSIGESSIFLVNTREQKYIQAREKEIALKSKILSTAVNYLYGINRMTLL